MADDYEGIDGRAQGILYRCALKRQARGDVYVRLRPPRRGEPETRIVGGGAELLEPSHRCRQTLLDPFGEAVREAVGTTQSLAWNRISSVLTRSLWALSFRRRYRARWRSASISPTGGAMLVRVARYAWDGVDCFTWALLSIFIAFYAIWNDYRIRIRIRRQYG